MADSLDDRGVLVSCPSCGKRNRLGYVSLGKTTRCGNCKAEIPAPTAPAQAATAAEFDAALRDSALPLVVDFWAPWCGPCRQVSPIVETIAAMRNGAYKVVKVNIDEEPALAQEYGVQSIPMIGLFRNGRLERSSLGAKPRQQIEAELGMLVIP
jgi:thioredoxin 2